jgi:drug/metabolite transporter (DMT)-like permease
MGWLFLLEFPVPLFVAWRRRASGIDLRTLFLGLGAGVFAVLAYALVLYAKTIAPLGAVSAVRESSVIIAALIGVLFFAERPWPRRLLSAAVVAAGVSTLAFSG